jgi:hypothetical protein
MIFLYTPWIKDTDTEVNRRLTLGSYTNTSSIWYAKRKSVLKFQATVYCDDKMLRKLPRKFLKDSTDRHMDKQIVDFNLMKKMNPTIWHAKRRVF